MRVFSGGRTRPGVSNPLRMTWTLGVTSLLAGLGGIGCEPGDAIEDLATAGSRSAALVTAFSPAPANIVGEEGAAVSFDIDLLCISSAVDPTVDITVNWGDGSTDTALTLTVTSATTTPNCGAGNTVVCDKDDPAASASGCFSIAHEYADGVAGGTAYPIQVTADHDGVGTQTASISATIANVAPTISSFMRSGAALEGSTQTFSTEASDQGTLAAEIAGVVWTFSPAAQVADPTTVTCDCAQAPDCDDGSDEPLCSGTDSVRDRVYLEDGSYTATLTITDKDGASDTASVGPTNINNGVPSDLKIAASGRGVDAGTVLSDDVDAGTWVFEGSTYALVGTFSDPGIDQFRSADPAHPGILWDLTDDGVIDHDGVAAITKASWPALDPASLAVGNTTSYGGGVLTPSYAWDDDNDNDPAAVTRTIGLTVQDDDGASGTITRFLFVRDVDPVIVGLTATIAGSPTTQVNEGTSVLFTLDARSGADDETFDPISSRIWRVDNNGDSAHPADADFAARLSVVAGCGPSDSTCELTFLDGDAGADNAYLVNVLVNDEDSSEDTAIVLQTRTITVDNVLPLLTTSTPTPSTLSESASTTLTLDFVDPAGALDGPFGIGIDWGDGATETLSRTAPGVFTVSHTFAENTLCNSGAHPSTANTCTIAISLCETGAVCNTPTTTSVLVQNVAPTASLSAPAAGATLEEGVPFTGTGSFTDPALALDNDYMATFSGFDVQALTSTASYGAGVSLPGARFTNVPATGRTATLTFVVADADGENGTVTRSVTITDNTPSVAVDSQSFVGGDDNEGSALPQMAVSFAAQTDDDLISKIEVNWGDGSPTQTVTTNVAGVDSSGGNVTITKPAAYDDSFDSYTVTVTVFDEDSSSSTQTSFEVLNVAPTLVDIQPAPPGPVVVSEGTAASFVAKYTDVSAADRNAPLLFHFAWGDGQVDADVPGAVAGATVTGRSSHLYASPGAYTVTITVSDKDGGVSSPTTISVEVVNVAPVVTDVFNTGPVLEGNAATVVGLVDNRGADALTYTFEFGSVCSPNAGVVDETDFALAAPGNGSSAVALSPVYANPGDNVVCFRVCDDDSLPNSCAYGLTTVQVQNIAPIITSVSSNGPVVEGSPVGVQVAAGIPAGDTLTFAYNFDASCAPADGVSEADFPGNAAPGGSASTVASHTFADDGSYSACVRVCDDDGQANSCVYGSTSLNVSNAAPVIASFPAPAPVDELAGGVSVQLQATATDLGVGDTLGYAYDCDDDGVTDVTSSDGSATCVYAESGTHRARVTVSDGDGGSATSTALVRVQNVAPSIDSVSIPNVNEGQASVITVDARDVGGDSLTYLFDYNNDGVHDASTTGGTASYAFGSDGAKTIAVRVCDAEGACGHGSGTTTVANVAPVIASLSAPSSVTVGSAVTVSAAASDVGNDTLSYLFTFKDGADTIVAAVGPQSSNVATTSFASSGAYSVEVTVSDQANAPNTPASATTSAGFSVTDINVAVSVSASPSVLNEGGTTTLTVTPNGTGPYLVSYDINGDGDFADDVDVAPADPSDTCTTGCSTTVTYAQNNPGDMPYRVLVSVVDTGAGDSLATAIVSVTVRNVTPTLSEVSDQSVNEGDELSLTLSGADVGSVDTLSYGLVSAPAGVSADALSGALTWTPGYADEGDNVIVASVTDSDGATAERSFTVTVSIIDSNGNGVSDTQERELNGGELLAENAATTDTDGDGVFDLDEILAGTDPNASEAPTAPVVISPNDDRVATLSPTLVVANATSPRGSLLTYTFVVTAADGGVEVGRVEDVVAGASTTQAVFDAATLDEDTAYEWYAFASDGLADGPSSDVASFIVNAENAAPAAPDALTPLEGATFAFSSSPVLEARAVSDPDGDDVWYVFELATADTFAEDDLVVVSALRAVPFFSVPEALAEGTYFWRAFASDGELDSDYGTGASFDVLAEVVIEQNAAPSTPSIVGPADETLSSSSATLEVGEATDPDGDVVSYQFEIADNPAFAGATSSGSQADRTFAVTSLEEDGVYYWRARAHDGELASDWVNAVFAVNAENSAPYGLAILSPALGVVLDGPPEGFSVSNAIDADGDALTYTFVLSEQEDLSAPLAEETIAQGLGVTTWTPEDITLTAGTTYYWSVEVSDGELKLALPGRFALVSDEVAVPAEPGCGCSAAESDSEGLPWFALVIVGGLLGSFGRRRRR